MKGTKSQTSTKLFITANDLAMHTNTNCETAFYFGEKSPFHMYQYL